MKRVIKRKLPLDVKYFCIDKKYVPLLDGAGTVCDNCGKLIANIATVKSVNGVNNIGFDCLETVLLNNNLLEGFDMEEYQKVKQSISKIIRQAKKFKEVIDSNLSSNITGMLFEKPPFYASDYITFYWLTDHKKESRNNDYIKLKDVDFTFLISTLKNIFPRLEILEYERISS